MGEIQSRSFQITDDVPSRDSLPSSRITSGGLSVLPGLSKRLEFIGQLLVLTRRRRIWSPFRILGEVWWLLTNIGTQREILRLLRLRPFAGIVQVNPELPFKYLIPDYLVRGLTVTERASCFLHHYKRMHSALPEEVLRKIMEGEVILYKIAKDGNSFAMTIGMSRYPFEKEGELSLYLQVDGKKVFNLSFNIVPGWVVKSEAPEALLISQLQGIPGCNSQIRLARRALNDYSPRTLLLAALQGIADAIGIGEIVAVCAMRQRSYENGCPSILKSGYDDFFVQLGMVKTVDGFYSSPIPIQGKPLASFKPRARSRARKRRANRQQIRLACADFLIKITDPAASPASGSICSEVVPIAFKPGCIPVSFSKSDFNRNLEVGDC